MAVEAAVRRNEEERVAAAPGTRLPRRRRWGTCEFEAWASDLGNKCWRVRKLCIEDGTDRFVGI